MLSMNARVTKFHKPEIAPEGQDRTTDGAAQAIGRALGAHYSDLVQAPLPDKLLNLLKRLDDEQQFPGADGSENAVG
jgi:hypothetical protein